MALLGEHMAPIEEIDLNHEGRIARLEESVHQVCTNHIPHIYDAIQDVRRWVQGLAIGGLMALAGLILKMILD